MGHFALLDPVPGAPLNPDPQHCLKLKTQRYTVVPQQYDNRQYCIKLTAKTAIIIMLR